MKGNLAPVLGGAEQSPESSSSDEQPSLTLAGEGALTRSYAAFLLALEADESVELDDSLITHLDAVGEAIGFL